MIDEDDCPKTEDWLVTYADAITLLMAFFVMLLTFAEYDIPAMQEASEAIANEIGGGFLGKEAEASPTKILKLDLEDMVYEMQADEVINVETDGKGVVMELDSSAFYKPGSADIREQAIPVLEKMAEMLTAPRYRTYEVEIEGHTDDDPIHTRRYPSNWELSAGRAAGIVRYFITQKMDPERLMAVGYADTIPKFPNRDANGEAIPENQAENRRVLVRVYPMSLKDRDKMRLKMQQEKAESEAAEEAQPQDQPMEKDQTMEAAPEDSQQELPQQPQQPPQQ